MFNEIIKTVLDHEGPYCVDHAGPTNWGITLQTLRNQGDLDGDGFQDGDLDRDGDIDTDDIRKLSPEIAATVYRHQWWDRYGYDKIQFIDVAGKVLDLSVNMGHRQMTLVLQRSLRACGVVVKEDGVLGPVTLSGANRAEPVRLKTALRCEAAGFYRTLVCKRPEFAKFLTGWLNRAYS